MADAGVKSVPTRPFDDQRPGTSGLRKPVSTFQQRHYLENYVQSIFDSGALSRAAPLVIGGDGRYHSGPALQTVAKMSWTAGQASAEACVSQPADARAPRRGLLANCPSKEASDGS